MFACKHVRVTQRGKTSCTLPWSGRRVQRAKGSGNAEKLDERLRQRRARNTSRCAAPANGVARLAGPIHALLDALDTANTSAAHGSPAIPLLVAQQQRLRGSLPALSCAMDRDGAPYFADHAHSSLSRKEAASERCVPSRQACFQSIHADYASGFIDRRADRYRRR